MLENFEHDYLVFDEYGLEKVLCMSCAKPIKTRSEIQSKFDSKIIRELAKHPDYREVPVLLEDGRIAFLMVCDDCKFVPMGNGQKERVSSQLKRAFRMQLEFEGKLPDLIDGILSTKNYNVARKAEVSEIVTALRGA